MAGETRLAVAEHKCDRCARSVEVKTNRSEKAYYICGGCGWRGEFTVRRFSDVWVEQLTGRAGAAPAPAARPAQAAPTPAGEGGSPSPAAKFAPRPVKRAGPFSFLSGGDGDE